MMPPVARRRPLQGLVIPLCVETSCDSVRRMRSEAVQQRSVVVVVREDRAD